MGTVLRRLGRRTRTLCVALALSLIAPSTANAAGEVVPVRPGELVSQQQYQNANFRFKNFAGYTFEQKMLARGAGAATATAGAAAVTYSFSDRLKSVASQAMTGAWTGAVSGCAFGGAAGLIGGPGAPATIPAGCMSFGLVGALAGGFLGAGRGAFVDIDQEGSASVSVQDLNQLAEWRGAMVDAIKTANSTNDGWSWFAYNCSSASHGDFTAYYGCDTGGGTTSYDAYLRYGLNKTFACMIVNSLHACAFVPTIRKSGNIYTRSGSAYPGGYGYSPSYDNFVNSRVDPACAGLGCWHVGQFIQLDADQLAMLIVSYDTYQSNLDVPYRTFSQRSAVPAWVGVLDGTLKAAIGEHEASDALLAGMFNHMWAKSGATGDSAFDPNNPITPADVAAAKKARPDLKPTVADTLVRPYDSPSRGAEGASGTKPVTPPVEVVNANPVLNTGTSQSTTIKAELDLGPAGDPAMPDAPTEAKIPMWDQIEGKISPWRNLSVNWPQAQCPVYPIDADFFGISAHWQIDVHCDLFADGSIPDLLLALFLPLCATVFGVRKFMEA